MDPELSERFEKLETHVAHLERQVDELNQVVVDQEKRLQKLHAQQQRLAESVRTAELERIRSTNPKPPHYQ